MKYTSVTNCISICLLRFVRDEHPTEADLLGWLGAEQRSRYYVLLKAGLLLLENDMVVLSPQHVSLDGKRFRWKHLLYNIDEETVDTF